MVLAANGQALVEAYQGYGPASAVSPVDRRLVFTCETVLWNLSTEAEESIYTCAGQSPAYTTRAGDTPANTPFWPRLVFPNIRQSLDSAGEPARRTVRVSGPIEFLDADGFLMGRVTNSTDYLDESAYVWRRHVLRIGALSDSFTGHEVIGTYIIQGRPSRDSSGLVSTRVSSAIIDETQPAYDAIYEGFDVAFAPDGSTSFADWNADANVEAGEDAYWRFGMEHDGSANVEIIWDKRGATTATPGTDGWIWYKDTSDQIHLRLDDGTSVYTLSFGAAGVYTDGARHEFQAWIDGTTLYGEVDGTSIGSTSVLGRADITNTSVMRTWRRIGATNYLGADQFDEMVFWTGNGIAPSADVRKAHREAPASIREAGAQYVVHFDEDTGNTAENAVNPATGDVLAVPKTVALSGTGAVNEEEDYGNNHDVTTGAFSVLRWARTDTSATMILVSKKNSSGTADAGYGLYCTAATARCIISDGTNEVIASGSLTVSDGVWRCYVMTWDPTAEELKMYTTDSSGTVATLHQTTDTTSVTGSLTNTNNLKGRQWDNGTGDWDGDTGSWSFYTGVLTQEDIERIAPTIPGAPSHDDIAGSWAVDENTGTTITDSVGSVNGTAGSALSWVDRHGAITDASPAWVSTLTGSAVNGVAGTSRPQCYGICRTIEPPLIDARGHDHTGIGGFATSWVYELHHDAAATSCESVVSVTEGGLEATLNTDYKLSSTNRLLFWDVSSSVPERPIRVTIKGIKLGGVYYDTLGDNLREILTENGHATTTELPAGSKRVLNNVFPYATGIHIPGGLAEPKTIGAVLEDALGPRLYASSDLEGVTYGFGRSLVDPDALTADYALTDSAIISIRSERHQKPVREVWVGYGRNWSPISEGDFLADATSAARDLFSNEWSWAKAKSSTVQSADSRVLRLTSALDQHADAQVEANEILGFLDNSFPLEITVSRYWWSAEILRAGSRARPDVVSVQSDYHPGLASAKKFLLIGLSYEPPTISEPFRVGLVLWRPE